MEGYLTKELSGTLEDSSDMMCHPSDGHTVTFGHPCNMGREILRNSAVSCLRKNLLEQNVERLKTALKNETYDNLHKLISLQSISIYLMKDVYS